MSIEERRESLCVCSLAGSSAVYFVLLEIASIGGAPRRCTPPPSLLPLLLATRLREDPTKEIGTQRA